MIFKELTNKFIVLSYKFLKELLEVPRNKASISGPSLDLKMCKPHYFFALRIDSIKN